MSFIRLKNVSVEFPVIDNERRFLRHDIITTAFKPILSATSGMKLSQKVGARILKHANHYNVLALDDVSLDLEPGDRLGIIGPNGSGKSTILRVMAGIYHPVKGSVESSGHTTTMFNMSQGMDPDASGLENIYLRARYLNISKKKLAEKVKEIVEFCELGDFINLPMRIYSSGMMVRLAFSITTIEEPDILIMDEVIGAGDAGFIAKAQARTQEYIKRAGLLVVASHSDSILREWCNKGLFLNQGRVVHYGPIEETIASYHKFVQQG